MGTKGRSHRNQNKRRRQQNSKQNKYQSKSARATANSVAEEDLGLQVGGTRARQTQHDARRTPSPQKPYQGPRQAKVKKGRVRAEQIREISKEIFGGNGTYYCVGRSNGSEVHQDRS